MSGVPEFIYQVREVTKIHYFSFRKELEVWRISLEREKEIQKQKEEQVIANWRRETSKL